MAAASSSRSALPHKQKQNSNSPTYQQAEPESKCEYEFGMTPGILQNTPPGTDLIAQFERVLQKAL